MSFLSSVSCSGKLIKPKEGVVGTSNLLPVGQKTTGNNLDLLLASEGRGAVM